MNKTTRSPCDGLYREIKEIIIFLNVVYLVLGVLGNSTVIIYNTYLNREHRTVTCWLITHLAIADLLVTLTHCIFKTIRMTGIQDVRNDMLLRKFTRSTINFSIFLSIVLLLFITIDRFLYIATPLKYPLIVTKRRIFFLLSFTWLASVGQFCSWFSHTGRQRILPKKQLYLNIVIYFVCLCVISVLNYRILKIVRVQRQRMLHDEERTPVSSSWLRRLPKEIKAMKTFIIVGVVLTICLVPYIIVHVVAVLGFFQCHKKLIFLSTQLVGINSSANPFIYTLRHRKYMNACKQLLMSLWNRICSDNHQRSIKATKHR